MSVSTEHLINWIQFWRYIMNYIVFIKLHRPFLSCSLSPMVVCLHNHWQFQLPQLILKVNLHLSNAKELCKKKNQNSLLNRQKVKIFSKLGIQQTKSENNSTSMVAYNMGDDSWERAYGQWHPTSYRVL